MKRAVVLVSGGLDSATCLGIAIEQGFQPVAVSFSYGQRHALELESAKRLTSHFGVQQHYVFEVGMFRKIGGSALTSDIEVPQHDSVDEIAPGIAATYVPARNTVFLAHALGVAEIENAWDIFIGVNGLDHAGYPDCRPPFIAAFEAMANVATAATTETNSRRLTIHAPLIEWTKGRIIQEGIALGVPYELTHSCYSPTPDRKACGKCDACLVRRAGFASLGRLDPVPYAATTAA